MMEYRCPISSGALIRMYNTAQRFEIEPVKPCNMKSKIGGCKPTSVLYLHLNLWWNAICPLSTLEYGPIHRSFASSLAHNKRFGFDMSESSSGNLVESYAFEMH